MASPAVEPDPEPVDASTVNGRAGDQPEVPIDDEEETGEEQVANSPRERFRAEFTPAFEAWVALDPLTTPGAPTTPFGVMVLPKLWPF